MENHKTYIRRGCVDIHRDQGIAEGFKRTLAERLFGHQYVYAVVFSKFKALCGGSRNVVYERLVFNQRNQKEGERVDNFVSELKRLSLACEFGELRDSLIRDRIVGGVLSVELREELLKKPDLTLQEAHDYCRTLEASELQNFKLSIPASAGTERSVGIHPC